MVIGRCICWAIEITGPCALNVVLPPLGGNSLSAPDVITWTPWTIYTCGIEEWSRAPRGQRTGPSLDQLELSAAQALRRNTMH